MTDTMQSNLAINPTSFIGRTLAETELLIKHLQAAEIGQVITYGEMKNVCKEDVQVRNTILATARKALLKPPFRMVFGTIVGVGIRRLSDEEIPDVGVAAVKRSRNIARKGHHSLQCADLAKMTPETKIRHVTTATILGLFQGAGSRKVRALAEQSARVENGTLKIGDMASLFSGK
jgi:hypothetical protein